MNRERQQRAERLFLAALEADTAQRGRLLDEGCAGDADLRADVVSLLEAHEDGGGVLDRESPITIAAMANLGAPTDSLDQTESPGTRIGAYTILEHIGSGGMGDVYIARQERPSRTVALKLIRRGLMTSGMLRRFEYEADILGRLRHPGIAQIYDAGTAPGPHGAQPYLAMELIRGLPLTAHAAARSLNVNERVALMVRVCDAVQHAHQQGVIHRDLKPANILVESEPGSSATGSPAGGSGVSDRVGQPRILDFGVARAIHSLGPVTMLRTGAGQLIGTLPYMSPEQVQGDPNEVDTRADVYALGVLLYELLAGRLPHDVSSRALPDAVRAICHDTPPTLASIDRSLRGDLDTIVQKAIAKDKQRRYQSAADLGADLSRSLAGHPIDAKRDSALYVIRTQLKRYRHVVGAGLAAAVVVVAFTVHATLQWRSNRRLAADLSTELGVSRDLSHRLEEELSAANIERGRLLTLTGSSPVGEATIWAELLKHPASRPARWALREYYAREPKLLTVPVRGSAPPHLVYSPSAGLVAFPVQPRTVEVWDDALSARVAVIPVQNDWIRRMAFSPDGSILATVDKESVLRLWNPRDGSLLRELPRASGELRALAFSPDGSTLYGGGSGMALAAWDVAGRGGPRTLATPRADISGVACAPDGARLAASMMDGKVLILGAASGTMEKLLDTTMISAGAVAFTRDGASLIVGGSGGEVGVWRVADWQRTASARTGVEVVWHLSMDEAGGALAVTGGSAIEILDLPSLQPRAAPVRNAPGSFVAALRRDGGAVYAAAGDGAISLWEGAPGGAGRILQRTVEGSVFAAAASPDGTLLASTGQWDTAPVLRTATGAVVETLATGTRGRVRALCFSPDGTRLALGTAIGDVLVFTVGDWSTPRRIRAARGVESLAFHPDGGTLVAAEGLGNVSFWDISASAKPPTLIRRAKVGSGNCTSVAYSADGSRVWVGAQHPMLALLDSGTGEVLRVYADRNQATDVAVSPDGRYILLAGFLTVAELRDAGTLERVSVLAGHGGPTTTAAFSPDSTLAATGSSDSRIRIWDLATARCLATLDGHVGEVSALGFLPDGGRLYSVGADGTTRLWDLGYCDRHIAGNLQRQAALYRAKTGEALDTSALERWAEREPWKANAR